MGWKVLQACPCAVKGGDTLIVKCELIRDGNWGLLDVTAPRVRHISSLLPATLQTLHVAASLPARSSYAQRQPAQRFVLYHHCWRCQQDPW